MAGLFVEELCDDMVSQSIFTAVGTDVFYNSLPDTDISPVKTCAVYEQGGIPHNYSPSPQIAVRFRVRSATSYEDARGKAAQVFNRYHGAVDISLTSYRILVGIAEGLPSSLGEDDNERHICDFVVMFRVVALDQGGGGGTGTGGKKDPNIEDPDGG